MDTQLLFYTLITLLLTILVALQISSRKKSDISQIKTLLKKSFLEQQEHISRLLSMGTTGQFEHFSKITESVQMTLMMNREEMNRQLHEFNQTINATVRHQMDELQKSNEKRLETMQGIVDEKLQKTLETRLTQSFEQVGKHLESVQQGLGEMKNLAEDARSLKHALTNVKDRGTYGEVRLERLLEDILAPAQYEKNAQIQQGKIVEFAIKLPGSDGIPVLLPVDAKFPIEDYNRLMDATQKSDIDAARKSLANSIRRFALDIATKYITPPKTTNFALMFLPTEGLYAEVIRDGALFEELREKYHVIPVGATTLSAFLNSLQIGFKTLAIEKHSKEVWDILGKVKSEFKKFEGALNTAHKQIKTAEGTLEKLSGTRIRAIERALRTVEAIDDTTDFDTLTYQREDF